MTIEVYDVLGRRVAVRHVSESSLAGPGRIELDSRSLASGVYFVKLNTGGASASRKIMIVR